MMMSDEPFLPMQPALMSPLRARNLARYYKGFATALRADGYTTEANQAERDAHWWLNYALALSQIPPGAIDRNGMP
jgi:hypothetical protein